MTTTITTTATTAIPVRLDFDDLAPGFEKALTHLGNAATKELDRAQIAAGLRELIRIRASQLNGCAYCVDMHSKDAAAVGESAERISNLVVWRETPFFTERERAALAFTEAVTTCADHHVPDAEFAAMAAQWDPVEIAAILSLIVSINAWNAIGVTTRTWEVGSYER